jgi:alpha-N-arabinofuranosidase
MRILIGSDRFVQLGALLLLSCVLFHGGVKAQNTSASVEINAGKVVGSINPGFYGQFVEVMFGGVDGPLWDELLRDRGFEEAPNAIQLPRNWNREPDDRDHDPALQMTWDDSVYQPVNQTLPGAKPGHSLRFDISNNQWNLAQRRGISQAQIPIHNAVPYKGYIWLKRSDFDGFVTVALEQDRVDGQSYASVDLHPKGNGWEKYEFTLTPTATDPLAKLSILFHGTGTIWLDNASLLPGDAVEGTRADVFARIKALHPAFVRWPGGNVAQNYRWMRGVGPRDQRPTWTNTAWWNETQSSDFGTDEYLRFCKAVGTQPSITVNVDGGGATVDEAAAWVEYVNGPTTSKYGSMRTANGHPDPYGVKYWEVGNEIFGKWEIAHTDAQTYAQNFNRYAQAMRKVDPTIKLIAVGNDLDWNRTVLQTAGQNIDLLAIHHYYGEKEMKGDPANLLAHPLSYAPFYDKMQEMIQELVPGHPVKLTINEWNTSLPVPTQHTMRSALYAGRMLNNFERHGSVIASEAVSDLVNGWSGGIIQASRDDLFVTPTYLVNKLYRDHLGTQQLAASVHGPTFNTTLEGNNVPALDVVVTRTQDGKEIFVKAVNVQLDRGMTVKLHLEGPKVAPEAELESVTAATPDEENTFRNKDAVSARRHPIQLGPQESVTLPPDSVNVVTLRVVP